MAIFENGEYTEKELLQKPKIQIILQFWLDQSPYLDSISNQPTHWPLILSAYNCKWRYSTKTCLTKQNKTKIEGVKCWFLLCQCMNHCRTRTNIQFPKWISSFAYEYQNLFWVPEKQKFCLTHSILSDHIPQNQMNFGFLNVENECWFRGFDGIFGATKHNEYEQWLRTTSNNIISWKIIIRK